MHVEGVDEALLLDLGAQAGVPALTDDGVDDVHGADFALAPDPRATEAQADKGGRDRLRLDVGSRALYGRVRLGGSPLDVALWVGPEGVLDVGEDLVGVHIAAEDERRVVGDIEACMIGHEALCGDLLDALGRAADRVPIGVARVGLLPHGVADAVDGHALVVRYLLGDDRPFPFDVVRRELRLHERLGQNGPDLLERLGAGGNEDVG